MKDKLYREVSVSERLPQTEGGVIAICNPIDGLQQLYFQDGKFVDPEDDHPMPATAWLEEVKLPTEEEIRKERDAYSYTKISGLFRDGWRFGIKYILENLEGKKYE